MAAVLGVRAGAYPPAFCRLLLCTLLLMPSSLSAVPHGSTADRSALTCINNFVLFDTFCYRFLGPEAKRPFHHAEKYCGRYHASLLSIHSDSEKEFVVQLAENNTAFWIGLNDEDGPELYHKEGVFKWTDGNAFAEASSYQDWRPGEPSNRRHLDCVKADHRGWAMAQGGCAASRLPFVCKKQACPEGLEWGGGACDVLTAGNETPLSLSSWTLLLAVSLLAVLTLASALCYCTIKRTNAEPHATGHSLLHRQYPPNSSVTAS